MSDPTNDISSNAPTGGRAPGAERWLGADRWLGRLGSVRNVVRQELAARYLAAHLPSPLETGPPLHVLDAGCGQGTQGLRLAAAGHEVTGLDIDPKMLAAFAAELAALDPAVRQRVRLVEGSVEDAPRLLSAASYDVVICHGVLMYLSDPAPAIASLAALLRPGGVLSLLARNQAGIAVRAGHRGRWAQAHAALLGGTSYVNELAVAARADSVEGLHELVRRHGLEPIEWYGVRTLSDSATLEAAVPGDDLAEMLAVEDLAGRTDPYRAVAPLFQLISART